MGQLIMSISLGSTILANSVSLNSIYLINDINMLYTEYIG